jgi:hypothetical protein
VSVRVAWPGGIEKTRHTPSIAQSDSGVAGRIRDPEPFAF